MEDIVLEVEELVAVSVYHGSFQPYYFSDLVLPHVWPTMDPLIFMSRRIKWLWSRYFQVAFLDVEHSSPVRFLPVLLTVYSALHSLHYFKHHLWPCWRSMTSDTTLYWPPRSLGLLYSWCTWQLSLLPMQVLTPLGITVQQSSTTKSMHVMITLDHSLGQHL